MPTASSMIFSGLVMLNEKRIGGKFSTAEGTYYLDRLNAMLESWSASRTFVYQVSTESFALTASTGTYTVGSSATFSTATRPIRIVNAYHRWTSTYDSPVRIIPFDSYAAITDKDATADVIEFLYYDQGLTAEGYGTIKVWPVPNNSTTLFIESWRQLQNFGNISTIVALPPGYQRAIESNFAIEVSPGTGLPVDQTLVKVARDSMSIIRSFNAPEAVMRIDYGALQSSRAGGNILSGP